MQWFGLAPFSRACQDEDVPHVATPVGEPCAWCEEPIAAEDDGFTKPHLDDSGVRLRPWHFECELRSIFGGLNHQRGRCICCGGSEPPDPPELSRREAARQAAAAFMRPKR